VIPDIDDRLEQLHTLLGRGRQYVGNALGAGPVHRRRLDAIDTRIAVSGVRGKSTTTRWLHDIFDSRGYDTFAKITGDYPMAVYNGREHDITRDAQVRLYENERVLAAFEDIDVAIFENQGIREYTTRLVNEQFLKPDVVFITNVREDHMDTLGSDRRQIARSLARAVPSGTQVVSGEQDPALQRYLTAELKRRDAPVTHVEVPTSDRAAPGAECVYGLNTVLSMLGEGPVPSSTLSEYLASLEPAWRVLPGGRVYDAASVNDVQSTDLVRQFLVGSTGATVEPLLNLRADRRGRTASFIRYLSGLYERGAIEQAHVTGDDTALFASQTQFPVHCHDTGERSAAEILDDALDSGRPVIVMGNTVTDFMRQLGETIERRAGTEQARGDRQ